VQLSPRFFHDGYVIKMIKTLCDYRAYVKADQKASAWAKENSFNDKIRSILLPNPIKKFQILLRKIELYKNRGRRFDRLFYLYYLIQFKRVSLKLGFSIPPNVFGPGLSIPHYGTIVVNGKAVIGANCRVHAGVNIGASGGSLEAPKIGNNVYIGPGAIIFGDISIADNVTIGANATVNRSIEISNCTVAGTPAKIVKEMTTVWWEKNKLDLSECGLGQVTQPPREGSRKPERLT
jgi:serine O-acetyltransferase